MVRKVSFSFILLNLFLIANAYPETILLKTGKTIEGKLLEKTDKYIKIDFYGVPLTYFMNEIESIDGQNPSLFKAKEVISLPETTSSPGEEVSADEQKCSLWEVISGDSSVYILGSINILKKNIYPLNKKIEDAFDKSEILVLDSNPEIEPDEKTQQLMFDASFFPEGDSLRNHLSKEILELLETRLALFSLTISSVERYRPLYLAMQLDEMKRQKQGIFPIYGIDRYFYQKAKDRKGILGLQSVEFVSNFMKGLSDSEQELVLYKSLIELDKPEKDSQQMLEVWLKGNTERMESMQTASQLFDDPRLKLTSEKIDGETIKNIFTKIEGFLTSGRTFFVVVGTGYLLGKKGVIELLKNEGYKVKQL